MSNAVCGILEQHKHTETTNLPQTSASQQELYPQQKGKLYHLEPSLVQVYVPISLHAHCNMKQKQPWLKKESHATILKNDLQWVCLRKNNHLVFLCSNVPTTVLSTWLYTHTHKYIC